MTNCLRAPRTGAPTFPKGVVMSTPTRDVAAITDVAAALAGGGPHARAQVFDWGQGVLDPESQCPTCGDYSFRCPITVAWFPWLRSYTPEWMGA